MADAQDLGSCVLMDVRVQVPSLAPVKMKNNFLTSLLGLNIYVYGLGISLSLVTFLFLFWKALRRTAHNEEKMIDSLFMAALSGLILARLAFVVSHWSEFLHNPLQVFLLINQPGLNEFFFWSGFFGYWWFFARVKKIPLDSLFRLLLMPVVVVKSLFGLLVLLVRVELPTLINPVILAALIGGYFLLGKIWEKDWFYKQPFLTLILYLAIPNFLIDFVRPTRVYLVKLAGLSFEQLPYLLVFLVLGGIWLISLLKREKKQHGS